MAIMVVLTALVLCCALPTSASPAQPTLRRAAPAPPQEQTTQEQATHPPDGPRLGVELAAKGPGCAVTFEALDELLLERHGRSPVGQDTLNGLVQLRVVRALAEAAGVAVRTAELNARWRALEEQFRRQGLADSLEGYLAANQVSRESFREHLELALLHEKLARADLGLEPDDPITGEQQTTWLLGRVQELGRVDGAWPWSEAPVARVGELVSISRAEFAEYLREQLPEDELRDAAYELLLEQRMLARVPDLSDEALARALDAEVERRRLEIETAPRFRGAKYEQLLQAQGLTLESVRADPAVRTAALAHVFVDRTHGDEGLRRTYEEERALFDSLHGEGWSLSVLVLKAAAFANDLNPRTFEAAEAELLELRDRAGSDAAGFAQLVKLHSEDPGTRERDGYLGVVTRASRLVPPSVRDAVWERVDAAAAAEDGEQSLEGALVGPVRMQGGVLLGRIGVHRPAPTWEDMSGHVHRELRRRLLEDLLPRGSAAFWLDA